MTLETRIELEVHKKDLKEAEKNAKEEWAKEFVKGDDFFFKPKVEELNINGDGIQLTNDSIGLSITITWNDLIENISMDDLFSFLKSCHDGSLENKNRKFFEDV